MKTGKQVLLCLLLWAAPFFLMAQCVDPLQTVSFDTTVTGAGNSSHTFNFPKFDATLGTLIEVVIRTEVTLRYRFQLENREAVLINNYRVRVVRDDEISSDAFPVPITNNYQTTYGPYSLAANDNVEGSGADYLSIGPVYAMNQQVIERTLYNTADYVGTGNISMDYSATTYSTVFGSVNYNYNGTAEDTVHMQVIYKYCNNLSLAADISSFTAVRANNGMVDIRWTALHERNGRNYLIEKSSDGRNFHPVAPLKAQPGGTANYRHNYIPLRNETGKLVFRLKQTEADDTVKYSVLRVVDLSKSANNNFVFYPNPSNGNFNLLFHNTRRNDWMVDVMTLSGQMLRQFQFSRALTGRINLQNDLPRGTYMLRITNKKTGEQSMLPLILR